MGHVRLGTLPRSKKWEQVVALIGAGSDASQVAAATMEVVQERLKALSDDPALVRSFWLLLQVSQASRTEGNFAVALSDAGVPVSGATPTAADLAAGLTTAVDAWVASQGSRSALGEMAEMAAAETLAEFSQPRVLGLFPDRDVQTAQDALASRSTDKEFGTLARAFFARLTEKTLAHFIARELPLHAGPDQAHAGLAGQRAFEEGLHTHCQEATRIVEKFASGWISKARFEGKLDEEHASRFVAYSLKKIRDELTMGAR